MFKKSDYAKNRINIQKQKLDIGNDISGEIDCSDSDIDISDITNVVSLLNTNDFISIRPCEI